MALINVKKKVEKSAAKLGIAEDETVLAACTTNPAGTVKKMLSRELGGALGSVMAGSPETATDDSGLAERYPDGQLFLALTDRRLLLASVAVMSGKPKELVAEWTRAEVVGIQVEKGRMAAPLQIAFSDGSAVEVEGAKGTNPESVALAFADAA